MKNLFRLSAGIACIAAILIAGSCTKSDPEQDPDPEPNNNKVEVELRYFDDSETGKKYLQMKNPGEEWVKATICTTFADPGNKVIWMFDDENGIDGIKEIKGNKVDKIFQRNARKMLFSKKFRLRIPRKTKDGIEKYDILIELPDGTEENTDPMLRVPTGRQP